jgi:hypothetical protein
LGAGVACVYLSGPTMDPYAVAYGRTLSMEVDLAAALQVDYREQPEADDAEAFEIVREEVLAGRPTMLSGDIFYLDYREFKVHFPGHRFVLVGFDDEEEKVYIADRIRPEPELCSYGALAMSRNPPEGMSTGNLWGRFHGTDVGRSLEDACEFAIRRATDHMLGGGVEDSGPDAASSAGFAPPGAEFVQGVAGIRRLAERLPEWATRDDATWLASFNGRVFEKFGNGGGNFRRLYAGFLEWAKETTPRLVPENAPELAVRAADGWTALSACLEKASEEGAAASHWSDAAETAVRIADLEEELFQRLAERVG